MSLKRITPFLVLYAAIAMACAWAVSWIAVFEFGFIHSNWMGAAPHNQNESFTLLLIELVCTAAILPPVFKGLLGETTAA